MEARCNNPYKLREKFGKKILMFGGIDKYALMKGRNEINKELNRLTVLLEQGGYIPMVDHWIPPEVSLDMFRYYIKEKRKWINKIK